MSEKSVDQDGQGRERKGLFAGWTFHSDMPIVVYVAVLAGIAVSWTFRDWHEDLSLNLISELLGAAFTLFIIDTLLVRSKTRRWKIVQDDVNYLIGRHINRIRDGVASRVFDFRPDLDETADRLVRIRSLREQRADFLNQAGNMSDEALMQALNQSVLFNESNYAYFNEKARDIWNVLNMRYADYLEPDLVSWLIETHSMLKDIAAAIRQYRKAEHFSEDAGHYHDVAVASVATSVRRLIELTNKLKAAGYSEPLSSGR